MAYISSLGELIFVLEEVYLSKLCPRRSLSELSFDLEAVYQIKALP